MPSQANSPHLVLMFKAPHRAKSRLRQQLTQADELASLLLDCALEDLCSWRGGASVAAAANEDAEWLRQAERWAGPVLVQGPGNLGERLTQIDLALRAQGHQHILIIGSDCPAMNQDYLGMAAICLERQNYVLGGAQDGGVSLMGAAQPWPPLENLPWSTHHLGAQLAHRCGLNELLPQLGDVDQLDDLAPLLLQLASDPRPARVALRDWLLTWQT